MKTGYLERRAGLEGRVAIVVGGGGGLGRACALDLGRAGMKLGLCDRNAELLAETREVLARDGVELVTEVLDAREDAPLTAFFERVDAAFGPSLHVLVNVVGGTFEQPFEESVPKGWNAIIRTNFVWLLHSIQLAIPRMRAAGGGSIINFTSIEAHRAAPGHAVYSGMKAAVANLGRTLALELGRDGIRVNAIAPDIVPTEGMAALAQERAGDPDAEVLDDLSHGIGIPLGRRGNPEDVGGCALFLASDLSRYITGQTLHPDGGVFASAGWSHWPGDGWRNMPTRRATRPYLDR